MATMARVKPTVTETDPSARIARIEQQIRARAYELYLERGAAPGLELDDWYRAEREILRAEREGLDNSIP